MRIKTSEAADEIINIKNEADEKIASLKLKNESDRVGFETQTSKQIIMFQNKFAEEQQKGKQLYKRVQLQAIEVFTDRTARSQMGQMFYKWQRNANLVKGRRKMKTRILNNNIVRLVKMRMYNGFRRWVENTYCSRRKDAYLEHSSKLSIITENAKQEKAYTIIITSQNEKYSTVTHKNAAKEKLKRAFNLSVAIKEHNEKIIYLKKIVIGGTSKSYGIHVAKMAGLPKEIIYRANQKLKELTRPNKENEIVKVDEIKSIRKNVLTKI